VTSCRVASLFLLCKRTITAFTIYWLRTKFKHIHPTSQAYICSSPKKRGWCTVWSGTGICGWGHQNTRGVWGSWSSIRLCQREWGI